MEILERTVREMPKRGKKSEWCIYLEGKYSRQRPNAKVILGEWSSAGLKNSKETTVAATLRSGGYIRWLDSGYTFKIEWRGSAARINLGYKRRFMVKERPM